ncbi:protein unc-93 homolog A-like [Lineus longissimus]|uniref:protein unc-93 homolog A-like n=1 Tax=Lineus longissimus TaxID=88925 RepID=UPI002B4E7FE6
MKSERDSPVGTRRRTNSNSTPPMDRHNCYDNLDKATVKKMASTAKDENEACTCHADDVSKCRSRDCVGEKIRSMPQPAHLAALREFDDTKVIPNQKISHKNCAMVETDEATFIYPEDKVVYLESPDSSDEDPNKDSLQSNSSGRALLAQTAREISSNERLPTVPEAAFGSCISVTKTMKDASNMAHLLQADQLPNKYTYIKNHVLLCISFMFTFTSFFSVRTLQSSINHDGGLGLLALSTFYCCYVCGCIFAPLVIQKARPKWTMFCGMIGHLFFNAANVYPAYYTLLPGACFAGFGTALLLIAQGTYLSSIACSYSIVTQKKIEYVMTTFVGIFILFLQTGQILGNVISSVVLKNLAPLIDPEFYLGTGTSSLQPAIVGESHDHHTNPLMNFSSANLQNEEVVGIFGTGVTQNLSALTGPLRHNMSLCGANYCHWHVLDTSMYAISPRVLYVLMGVYTCCIILALITNGCFINKLDIIFQVSKKSVWQQLTSVGHMYADKRMMLIFALLCWDAFLQSFTFGDVVKAFTTCSLGVHMVGYTVICYGLCASVIGAMSGLLQKLLGRVALISIGVAGSYGLFFFLMFWAPHPQQSYVIFLIFGGLGVVDGIIMTQCNSLVGLLFQKKKEPAFAFAKMHQALTLALFFGISQFLCMRTKIIIGISFLTVAYVLYIALEVMIRPEKKKKKSKSSKMPKPVNV